MGRKRVARFRQRNIESAFCYPVRHSKAIWHKVADSADESITSALTTALNLAHSSLLGGAAVPGPDAGNAYDPFLLALPASATAIYCNHKMEAVREQLGEATTIWEAL